MSSTFEVRACSDSLLRDDVAGIWKARQSASVSYPENGHAACFQLEDGSFWFNHRNRCIAEAVGQWSPSGFILDVGGGNGYVAGGLIQAGHEAVVLEPGDEGARNARTLRKIPHVICATLADAAFKPASVPAIGLFDVLEHVDDDEGFVAEMRRILRPDGLVYVTVPAHQWLWTIEDVEAGHFRRYSTHQLASRFEAAGFEVLYVTYFFELLVVPVYLLRTLPGRLGLRGPRKASHYEVEHAARVGWLSRTMRRLLERELGVIASRRALATGTSCLLVARKAR
jgi:SAM-dependent methyltransferase